MSELLYDIDEPAQAKLVAWRETIFDALGFEVRAGRRLAMRRDIDTHDVARLLDKGATHAQAVAICL